jgi:hypothetical protein
VAATPRETPVVTHFAHMVLAMVLSAVPGIDVRGNADCPTPGALAAALEGLIAPAPSGAPAAQDVVELSSRGGSVTVKLTSAGGDLVGEKHLPERLSCGARAQAAAVMVAAWEAHLRGVAAPIGPAAQVRAPTLPPPVAAPAPAPPAPATPRASPATAVVAQPLAPGAPAPSPPVQLEVSTALFASVTAAGVAPGGIFEVGVARADAPLALEVGAVIVGAHRTGVATGRGLWRRYGGVVELDSRSRWRSMVLHIHGGAALSAVTISGQSFPSVANDAVFDPGIVVGLRLALAARLAPWVGATAVSWPRAHTLTVGGSPASVDLPQFETWLGGGLTFGRRN